jgi:SAM-dependent methyltransferase
MRNATAVMQQGAPTKDALRTAPQPVCALCASGGHLLHASVPDHYFGVPGSWSLKRCETCSLVWQDPMVVPDDLVRAYGNYYTVSAADGASAPQADRLTAGFLRLDRFATQLLRLEPERRRHADAYLDALPLGRLLDVGCGSGAFAARMKRAGWRAVGTEFDPVAAERARKVHGIEVELGDLAEIAFESDSFDAITVRHVVEHVREPVAFLQECWRILKPGGRLIFITPNVDGLGHGHFGTRWRGLEQPRHLYLFNVPSMSRLFERAGVAPVEVFTTAQGTAYTLNASALTSRGLLQRCVDQCAIWWFQWRETVLTRAGVPAGEELVAIATKPTPGAA